MQFSLSRCPPSTKSGVGVYEDRGSSWPQVNPVCPLTLPHPHYTHFSCLVGFLGCKHGWNRPNGCKFLTSSWPSWWSWTLPSSFPAMSISWGWFLPFTVSNFDLQGPRYAVAKAQNGNFGDGSRTVWPATWAKSVKMVKTCPPLEPSPRWLGDGQKKICILSTLAKVMGVQSQAYQKTSQKCHISGQIWG